MRIKATFLASLILVFAAQASYAAEAGTLSVSGGQRPVGYSGPEAFVTSVPRVTATLSVPLQSKAKVEFRWIEPSGAVYSDTVKLLYPRKGQAVSELGDYINVAGAPPSGKRGWWRVEASISGENLSKEFFLTDNRQVPAFFYGSRKEKIEVLSGLDQALHGSREIIQAAFKDASPAVRSEVFEALFGLGGPWAAKAAEKASSDASPAVRALAAERIPKSAVGGRGRLMGLLIVDKDAGVREAALASLSGADGAWATKALAEGLKADDPAFRKEVLNVIAIRKGERAGALAEGLKDPDPAVRSASLGYLINQKKAVPADLRPLVGDPEREIAASALGALAALGDREGIKAALSSPHQEVRLQVVRLLSADPAGNAAALAGALKDESIEVRREAVAALVKAGKDGMPGLIVALDDKDNALREGAASALERGKAIEARARMLAALGDPSPVVRLHALMYFISVGGPGLTGILERAACDESLELRSLALGRLMDTPGEEASGALAAFYECGDINIKNTVIDSLAARRDARAQAALVSALKDKDSGIRFKAASALLASGAHAPFGGLLDDPAPAVRRLALAAVQAAPDPALIPALERLAKDPDPDIRLGVLDAARDIPGDPAASVVVSLLGDGSAQVRDKARSLLLGRREVAAIDALFSMATGGSPEERKEAAEALSSVKGDADEEALLRLVSRGQAEERLLAVKALSERISPRLAAAVKTAFADPDERVRMAAIEKVGGLPDASGIYTAMLSSAYNDVKRAGIHGLHRPLGRDAEAALNGLLRDGSPELRREALKALVAAGDASVYVEALPRMILDPDAETRGVAYRAAVSLPDGRPKADALIAAAGGPYPDLSQVAAAALVPLGDPRALPFFEKFLADSYDSERMLDGILNVPGAAALSAMKKVFEASGPNSARKIKIIKSAEGRGPGSIGMLEKALRDDAHGVREEAVGVLARRWMEGGKRWEEALGAAVRDEDLLVRKTAFDALLKGDAGVLVKYAVPALADRELKDAALAGLRERGGPEALPAVFECAKGLKDAGTRAGAVRLLRERGYDQLAIAKAFSKDPSRKVRAEVIKALSGRPGYEAALWLARMGCMEQGPLRVLAWDGVKNRGTEELGRTIDLLAAGGNSSEAASFLAAGLDDSGLLKRLVLAVAKDPDALKSVLAPIIVRHAPRDAGALVEGIGIAVGEQRDAAIGSVAQVGGEGGEKALSEAFRRYPASRAGLLSAAYGTAGITKLLPAALKDPDPAVRREAARSLSVVSGPGAEGVLIIALSCPEEDIRLTAADSALAGNMEKPLVKAAVDASPAVRTKAAAGLRGFPAEVKVLKDLVFDRDSGVAGAALYSLREQGDKVPPKIWADIARGADMKDAKMAALESLIKRRDASLAKVYAYLLQDADAEISAKAEEALTLLGPEALPDVNPLMRKKKLAPAVLRIIRKAADPSSEPFIIEALPGLGGEERLLAVDALGWTGGDAGLKYLACLYAKGDLDLKVAALKAVGGLRLKKGTGEAERLLTGALTGGDEYLRFYAAHAAGRLRLTGMGKSLEEAASKEGSAVIKMEMEMALEKLNAPGSGKAPTRF